MMDKLRLVLALGSVNFPSIGSVGRLDVGFRHKVRRGLDFEAHVGLKLIENETAGYDILRFSIPLTSGVQRSGEWGSDDNEL